MSRILQVLPELTGDEQLDVARRMQPLSDAEAQQFAHAYRARRKDPTMLLVLTLVGLFGFAGIQRLFVGQIGMGLLFFFTAGFCGIGTIVDAINHQKLAAGFNRRQADEVAMLVRQHLGGAPAPPRLEP